MTDSRQNLIAPLAFFASWIGAFGWMILHVG
jgi:hypothetical protein